MRVWQSFLLLVLLAQPSEDPREVVHNIPKRYKKDWRLFCNVCNHFISSVKTNLNKSIQDGDEHDFGSRVGFRLDSEGKKRNLKQRKVDIMRSEIKITEVMDEDLCKGMKVDAVLYDKKSKLKEGVRMLQKNQKIDIPKNLAYSRKRKYVSKANLYCAEIAQRFYEQVIETFTSENIGSRDSFCTDHVDSRCPLVSELPTVIIKPKKKKARTFAGEDGSKSKVDQITSNASVVEESESEEGLEEPLAATEGEGKSQLLEETAPEQVKESLAPEEVEPSSVESDIPEESEKHDEL